MKVEVLIITHGKFGRAMLDTASDITGRVEGISAREVDRGKCLENIEREIKSYKKNMVSGENLLILTDMLGGTPFNICAPLAAEKNVEIISGVNLPMLVSVIHKKDRVKSLRELAGLAVDSAKKGVVNCSWKA